MRLVLLNWYDNLDSMYMDGLWRVGMGWLWKCQR